MQKWKPIKGFENEYIISSNGIVSSLSRVITTKYGTNRKVTGRYLKPKNNGQGYLFVSLSKNGVRKDLYIHRLVATAFLKKPTGKNCVNHKDGNPSNNAASNLEWVNHSENVHHAYQIGLYRTKGNIDRKTEESKRKYYQHFQPISNESSNYSANR